MEAILINTILHTKDGRKIGNAIVTNHDSKGFEITTDYGNKVTRLTEEEIREMFYIAWENMSEEVDGYSYEQMQEMMSSDHKHRVVF